MLKPNALSTVLRIGSVAGIFTVMLAFAGCAADPAGTPVQEDRPTSATADPASTTCTDSVAAAVHEQQNLFDSHPLHTAEVPGADATAAERAAFEELIADEESQWLELMSPVYEACEDPDEWLEAVREHPEFVGVTSAEDVDTLPLQSWCLTSPESPACAGLEQWLEDAGR